MMKHQRRAVRTVKNMSLFLLFLLSGLLCSTSGLWREYHYINQNMSWPEAQSYCRERFSDLATADSMNDVNRMISLMNDGYNGSVWIGLKRATQSRWGWSNGNDSIAQYSNWDTGQPNNPLNERCVVGTGNGFWHDMSCNQLLYFICYNESTGYVRQILNKNWTDAQSYCRQYHTDLATVRSTAEKNQQSALVVNNTWDWIGLFLDSWQWSDQWSLFFRNWVAGYPSDSSGSGDCVAMSKTASGKWTHDSCDLKRPVICHGRQKPLYRHYLYVNERMSWTEAQSYCRERFTDLATVDSIDDVKRMIKTVNSWYSGSVWIGLKRATQSRWGWSNGDDTVSQFSGWRTGYPSGDKQCAFFAYEFWYNHPCSSALYFVCYDEGIGYTMISLWKNWTEAQSYCRQYHTDLATIRSRVEQTQLYSVVGYGPWVWIGLFLNSWQWSDQSNLFNFRYWAAGYTSHTLGSGDCVAMTTTDSGKWIQNSCDQKLPFLCSGDDKIIKSKIAKLLNSCSLLRSSAQECNSSESFIRTAILNQIREKLNRSKP